MMAPEPRTSATDRSGDAWFTAWSADTASALSGSCRWQHQRTRTPSMMTALGEDNIARSSRGSS